MSLIRVWLCRDGAKGEKAWERSGWLGEVPRGSLELVHRGLQHSDARQPSLQASTGCLQGILQETKEFYRKSANFYRMCCKWKFWVMVK